MKKTFFFLLLAGSTLIGKAQNYTTVMLDFTTNKFEDAKNEVDKLMADPKAKDNPQTLIWKYNVYSAIYADSTLKPKYPDAGQQAWDALQQYTAKDTQLAKLKEDPYGMTGISKLYGQSFNYGKSDFQKSEWNKAFEDFSFCQQVSEFIGKNGLNTNGKYTIDTTIVLYAGYAAQNAGKQDEAAKRYKALADYKIGDKDMVDMYKYILDYETKKKDQASFTKYLAIAKELYPNDAAVWSQFEMNYMSSNTSLKDMIGKYKADDASGKLKEDGYTTYAEAFAMPDKNQLAELDSAQQADLKLTASDAFIKAFNKNDTNGLYAFNAGVLYYNLFGVLDDRYYNLRGESAALKTQRDDVLKQQKQLADSSIDWLEKGYTILKAKQNREKNESASLNRAVDYLANLYAWKRDRSKGTNAKDFDAFDAKFKQFDSEHDKYKVQQ